MASLRKTGSSFVVCFRLNGSQIQRSLRTGDRRRAEVLASEIEGRLGRLALGEKSLPAGADPVEYVLTGRDEPPAPTVVAVVPEPPPGFGAATDEYLATRRGVKADSTVATERVHLGNVRRELAALSPAAAASPLSDIGESLFDRALHARKDRVSSTTVSKERQTLRQFLRWAASRWSCPPLAEVPLTEFPEEAPDDPFRTAAEIEHELARGGLSHAEVAGLWSRLYLTPEEVGEVLGLVRARSFRDFIPVMHSLAAFTGMRRGEILRLRWSDVDLARGIVTAKSRKQSRTRKVTSRAIDLHGTLADLLRRYKAERPAGQFVVTLPGSAEPLTVDQANDHFRRPLKGTRWEKAAGGARKKVVVRWHVYRHSFASNLAASGESQPVIDSLMGHVTPEMRRRYQHLRPALRRSAVESLEYGVAPAPGGIDDAS